jgi:hypothetical protein
MLGNLDIQEHVKHACLGHSHPFRGQQHARFVRAEHFRMSNRQNAIFAFQDRFPRAIIPLRAHYAI